MRAKTASAAVDDEPTGQAPLTSLALETLTHDDDYFRDVLGALPAAIYITNAAGHITYFNEAAASLWGHRPDLGTSAWCGSWKLFHPDGRPMPHDQCPMAMALKQNRPIRGMEAMAERPDGTRVSFVPFPTPLRDAAGTLLGAVNMLVELTERKSAEEAAQFLAAIVESSDDAILTKNLDGIITSWNRGATRLFGYTADEVVGKSITILIPVDRHNEEPTILARIRRGERVDHYETIRRRKDGSLVEISLTVSPVKRPDGTIIGASKIARDITERKRAQQQQRLLLREMDHRIKNLFTLSSSVVSLSARSARTPRELATEVGERLSALARAHALTLPKPGEARQAEPATSLHALIRTIASPYDRGIGRNETRISVSGPDISLAGDCVTAFALLLHEFATNAAKYGALSVDAGHVDVRCSEDEDQFVLTWTEHGGPRIEQAAEGEGFGSLLARVTVKGQLDGEISRDWIPEGLVIRLSAARRRITE